jgi:Leucine-rich repeat (LRR) protein
VLYLYENLISDISALNGLTSLTQLQLQYNLIDDVSALSGLTSLTGLRLENNFNLSNIQPLLDNSGLGEGDTVSLTNTMVSCMDVADLELKGVTVIADCQ